MGVSIEQYRAAIGKYCTCKIVIQPGAGLSLPTALLWLFITMIIKLLILLSSDIHQNPGPIKATVRMCHINVRSLSTNTLLAIEATLSDTCDIITLSETYLNNNSNMNVLKLNGYRPLEYLNRPDRPGGGVGIYVKNFIIASRRSDFEVQGLEAMWHELRIGCKKLLVCTCYRPPNSGVVFWNMLSESLELAQGVGINDIIITGDLNSDPLTFNGRKLNDFAESNNLYINVHEPTRITSTTSSILDQILTSRASLVSNVCVEPPVANNDHCSVIATINIKASLDPPYERLMWNYKKADIGSLKQYLRNTDWDKCFESEDIDIVASHWTETLINAARQFIPNKMATIRPKDKPWYNNDLRARKRKVMRLFRKAKLTGSEDTWNRYKQLQNEYCELIELAKKEFESKKIAELHQTGNGNKKAWWKAVKHMLGFSHENAIPTIINNNIPLTDSKSKAELFNDFFCSHSNIDSSGASLPNKTIVNDVKLESITFNQAEVLDILKSLDPNKSVGLDGVSPRLLKLVAEEIAPSLTRVFNCSMSCSKFPSQWKLANVIPIYKKGKLTEVSNYRPVSLLSCLSKVFEKVVFRHLFNFFRENMKLSIHQSGFMPGDSTVNQLVYLYDYFSNALDKKKDVHIVFCDITKAFDRVWHKGLIYKLKENGVEGNLLSWLENYLQDRKQRVTLGGQHSSWCNIKAGVPQGSVLGPLMFIVYINDIVDNIKGNIKLFADDTALYIDVDNTSQGEQVINADLLTIENWASQWLVNFNPSKTVAMKLSLKSKPKPDPVLYFGNQQLEIVTHHKHLGLEISNKLTWQNHINRLVTKANQKLAIIKQLKWKLNRKTLEILYMSFVRPSIEYGSIVWDNCDDESKLQLDKIQIEAAKVVTGAIKGTHHDALLAEVGWESLGKRRERQKLLLYHRMINNKAPVYLCNIVPTMAGLGHEHSTRYAAGLNFTIPKHRLDLYSESFLPEAIRLWNQLPINIKSINDYSKFAAQIVGKKQKIRDSFYYGNRVENVLHARLRMKCSSLRDDLFRLHIIDNPICLCGQAPETDEHYFFWCPLYANQRNCLLNSVDDLPDLRTRNITTNTLLYGIENGDKETNRKLVDIVHEYIKTTNRFNN